MHACTHAHTHTTFYLTVTCRAKQFSSRCCCWVLTGLSVQTDKTHVDTKYEWDKMAAALMFCFVLLPSPVVDENWDLPTYCLVLSGKMMPCTIETFCELQIHWMFPILLVHGFLLTSFICSLLNCEYHCNQVTPPLLAVCSLILDYAVHTFSTTDTKYVMFRVGWHKSLKASMGWHKSLKASMTPDYLVPLLADSK